MVRRDGVRCGQLHLAREISQRDRKRQEALQAYDALVFAAGTNLSKESLLRRLVQNQPSARGRTTAVGM